MQVIDGTEMQVILSDIICLSEKLQSHYLLFLEIVAKNCKKKMQVMGHGLSERICSQQNPPCQKRC